MYITISPQKIGGQYAKSVADFVNYLEKENKEVAPEEEAHFFNHHGEEITARDVVKAIDGNTAKLKTKEPKFYSITVNPSQRELRALERGDMDLKQYTKGLMEEYVKCFNREIDNRPPQIQDILYFAKIEQHRRFKPTDKEVRENQVYASKILECKNEIRKIENGLKTGKVNDYQKLIQKLEQQAPHKQEGQRIVPGMLKTGRQSHVHIIVSRKDASNRFSLSPGSKNKGSEVEIDGKLVKRGFDRDQFFQLAEQRFDTIANYQRNYVESYSGRKTALLNPKLFYATLLGLPTSERALAMKLLNRAGMRIPAIPTSKVQLATQVLQQLKRGLGMAMKSGSIEY